MQPEVEAEDAALLRREQDARVPLLFEHFAIDTDASDAWERLARALAERHVPGFSWRLPAFTAWGSLLGDPFTDLGNLRLIPYLKRRRGRPRKARDFAEGGGLLGLPIPKKRGARSKVSVQPSHLSAMRA